MAIYRKSRPETNYYCLDKSISEDKRLSWGARGLLVFLLGKPDNWQVSVTNLVNQTAESVKPSGRDSVYSLLSELVNAGYVIREQSKNQNGKFGSIDYIVCESFEDKPHTDKPHTDKPHTDKPHTANPTQTINELKQLTKKERSNDFNNATSVAKNLEKLILIDFGIVGDLQSDFVKHRKSKKAPITKTVMNGFQREADKAGISITDAVRISIERGWVGFKADWNNENNLRTFSQKPDKLDSTIQAGIDWLKGG